ncbi:methyltransferase domain-containing protein, partial [Chitinimonas sp.]|uniref:methyltransferase domain-containing protein n=1 Tax=Chitinimonas sp. TaxID=1934313 RepID=UPI0035AF7D63
MSQSFDQHYYQGNGQDGDRPALWFYQRLAQRWIAGGTVLDFGCGTGHFVRRLGRSFVASGFERSPY